MRMSLIIKNLQHFSRSASLAFLAGALLLPSWSNAQLSTMSEGTTTLKVTTAEEQSHTPASVEQVTDMENLPRSFWVNTLLGDSVLRNDLSFVSVGDISSDFRLAVGQQKLLRQGGLLDITTSMADPENFHLLLPNTAGANEYRLQARDLTRRENDDKSASVIVEYYDSTYPFLTARTEFNMPSDMPGVLVTTTLTNTSEEYIAKNVIPSDFILWGAMSPFVPGKGWATNAKIDEAEFIFARRYDVWMLIAPESGTMDIDQRGELCGLSYGSPSNMEPGETKVFRRWVLTSKNDPAYLYSKILEKRPNADFGTLLGRVIEREQTPDGAMMERGPVGDCDIFLSPVIRKTWTDEQRSTFMGRPYLITTSQPNGVFNTLLPSGDYRVIPAPESRLAPIPNYTSKIEKDKVEAIDFGVSASSRLIYKLVDADTKELIPGKLTIEPLRGTRSLELGPPSDVRAGNVVLSSHGAGIVELPPGSYRVIASRGPEYHTVEQRIKVNQVKDTTQVFVLKRAFETPGWISADVGVRTDATVSSRVSKESRVVSAVAEGVEWLVSGDTDTATDLQPAVESLGLSKFLTTSPGFRHSGDVTPFRGDFLLFPTNICSSGFEPDFTPVRAANSSREILASMRALCPEAAILVSRPVWPSIGYLSLQGFDPTVGTIPEGDWSRDFDAFQIWEGKRQGTINEDYLTYHNLLREGMKLTAFGASNSHETWMQEPGYPRVYVKSSTDDPSKIDPEELARNIKNRQVCVTNGPFVSVKVNGKPMGSLVTDTDGSVDLEIEVQAANWVQIESISVNLNGLFVRKILLNSAALDPNAGCIFPPKDSPEDGKLKLTMRKDAVLDVVVEGSIDIPMDPVNPFIALTRDNKIPRGQFPMAISAPTFLDIDGDGKITMPKVTPEGTTVEGEAGEDPPF